MSFKTPVVDRIPTYPGRVKLTPVSGQTDVYDLTRADQPIEEGTPINKVLFDQKAYCLTGDVTVFVATTGSDQTGDGSSAAPYATIQKALDSLPKWLDGYTATIDITDGTYEGRVSIDGFQGGTLVVGIADRTVTVRGVRVTGSSVVKLNISNIVRTESVVGSLLALSSGSMVHINNRFSIDALNAAVTGVVVETGSTLMVTDEAIFIVHNCGYNAIYASGGSRVSLSGIAGSGNAVGLRAETGAMISFSSRSLTGTTENITATGGRIYTGAQSNTPNY